MVSANHSLLLKVEEKIQCVESGKVRYTSREETLLALPIPLEAVLNKGNQDF